METLLYTVWDIRQYIGIHSLGCHRKWKNSVTCESNMLLFISNFPFRLSQMIITCHFLLIISCFFRTVVCLLSLRVSKIFFACQSIISWPVCPNIKSHADTCKYFSWIHPFIFDVPTTWSHYLTKKRDCHR